MGEIKIKNACLHNLKNVNINIPRDKFVVVTGVSGSGKSSLVFDILYKEGKEAYLSSIGFSKSIEAKRGFESIKGICPSIAVEQRTIRQSNPRSVVGTRTRILEYLKLLFSSDGKIMCKNCGSQTDRDFVCPKCGTKYNKPELKAFSFNSVKGMCPECQGRGIINKLSVDKVLRKGKVSLEDICKPKYAFYDASKILDKFSHLYGFDKKEIYENLSDEVKEAFVYGFSREDLKFEGIIKYLERRMETAPKVGELVKVVFSTKELCKNCKGEKLNEAGRSVLLGGKNIPKLCNMTIKELKAFLLIQKESGEISQIGQKTIETMLSYIDNIIDGGLSHLSLYRETSTLSGGELQRLFLMSHLGSKLDSILYVFDEPTSGLHEAEKEKLLDKIKKLRDIGNSIIIVEHDKNTIERAEHIIEFGLLAGKEGGQVIYEGSYDGILNFPKSITGSYLSGRNKVYRRQTIKLSSDTKYIHMENVKTNNLKGINVDIPLGCMVGICGLSGSGKSSLISDTLIPELKEFFNSKEAFESAMEEDQEEESEANKCLESISGLDNLKGFIEVSQSPIGRNSRSMPASYIGIWDKIRDVFAKSEEALSKGLKPNSFSFNSEGACLECKGTGIINTFIGDANLPFLRAVCPKCNGNRYSEEISKIKYNGKNIMDVLEMNVSEAAVFFKDNLKIYKTLKVMEQIGMGYMVLGQPMVSLSGGEAQRIKLAGEISKAVGKKNQGRLYIFDEPTTGLSFYDIDLLMPILDELVKKGNSVLIIEHDPWILSNCDYIIELGPEGGNDGGEIIAKGLVSEIIKNPASKTGKYLSLDGDN